MRLVTRVLCALTLVLAFAFSPADAGNPTGTLSCPTMQNATSSTGNGTACPIAGYSMLTMQVSGTAAGAIAFEGSVDGTNYTPLLCYEMPSLLYITTNYPRLGTVHCTVKGYAFARARLTQAGTSVTVAGLASQYTVGTGFF